MTRLRLTPIFKFTTARPSPRTGLPSKYIQQHRYAGSSYGGGEGDPKGENPSDQGSNPSAGLEHPGPAPPKVGQGTGGGPTKSGADGHNTTENASSDAQGGAQTRGGKGGPQPKIHKHVNPEEHSHSEEVRKHNEDMSKRHDRAEDKSPDSKENDKVGKGFWSGESNNDVWLRILRVSADSS